ncbi:hypothetical protein L1765_10865 [Microaerobacter geothermalis]|uniref:hypothetical protein n=1 Tax=Microaerobacter geothermalis TaxID=674972 RepID=UPI001F1C4FFF|nr:hypothetical protein [Microaerobacter geothermalis]MCF6094467.1 hypothetical protein [Microaerobacter geothermalis]
MPEWLQRLFQLVQTLSSTYLFLLFAGIAVYCFVVLVPHYKDKKYSRELKITHFGGWMTLILSFITLLILLFKS